MSLIGDPPPNRGKTPGYASRLRVAFTVDRHGKPVAYYWSGRFAPGTFDGRWIRMNLAEARSFVASDEADQVMYQRKADLGRVTPSRESN